MVSDKCFNNESYEMIIIGASGGIGQHLVGSFRKMHKIIGTYCNVPFETLLSGPTYYHVDMNDSNSITNFCGEIITSLRRPVLIYLPGISPNNLVHKITEEDWIKTMTVNLTGAMIMTRELLPRMVDLKFGRFIYISSILSRKAVPGTAAYSVTKAGLNAFSRVVAVENAKKGITANALALGYFDVGIIKAVPDEYLKKNVLPTIPMGRLGDPSNIVEAIKYLIQADYMTGTTLDINGGALTY